MSYEICTHCGRWHDSEELCRHKASQQMAERISELEHQLAEKTRELEDVTAIVNAYGGFHKRSDREAEIESALAGIPQWARVASDHAIAELLAIIDAGRGRLWKAEEEIAELKKKQVRVIPRRSPRRMDLLQMTPEERALFDLIRPIEDLGAHPLLTDAVILIGDARDKLGDWVDAGKPGSSESWKKSPTGCASTIPEGVKITIPEGVRITTSHPSGDSFVVLFTKDSKKYCRWSSGHWTGPSDEYEEYSYTPQPAAQQAIYADFLQKVVQS